MLEELGLGEDRLEIRDRWECGECGKEFRTDRLLYFHERKQHKNPMSCIQCFKTLSSEVKFQYHKANVHGVQLKPKHLCPTCGKTFTHSGNFSRHVKNHEVRKVPKKKTKGATRYHCSRCPKHFSHKRSLAHHIRLKHRSSCTLAPATTSTSLQCLSRTPPAQSRRPEEAFVQSVMLGSADRSP